MYGGNAEVVVASDAWRECTFLWWPAMCRAIADLGGGQRCVERMQIWWWPAVCGAKMRGANADLGLACVAATEAWRGC